MCVKRGIHVERKTHLLHGAGRISDFSGSIIYYPFLEDAIGCDHQPPANMVVPAVMVKQ